MAARTISSEGHQPPLSQKMVPSTAPSCSGTKPCPQLKVMDPPTGTGVVGSSTITTPWPHVSLDGSVQDLRAATTTYAIQDWI